MTNQKKSTSKEIQGLSLEELEGHTGEHLPDREEMSLVNANVAAPVNLALAANLFSDNSTAIANAEQNNFIEQNNEQNNFEDRDEDNFEQYGYMQDNFRDDDFMRDEELVNANVAAPVNAGVATNVFSDDSTAIANAEQNNFIEQNNEQDNFEDRDEDGFDDRYEDRDEDGFDDRFEDDRR